MDQSPDNDPAPTAQDEAIDALRSARSRDELLSGLLRGAAAHLDDVQIFAVSTKELRGLLALDEGGLRPARSRLSLDRPSIARRAVQDGILYIGPVPAGDPCSELVSGERLERSGLVFLPIRCGSRTVCALLGHPRSAFDRERRDLVAALGREASGGLQRLIEEARQRARGDEGEREEAQCARDMGEHPRPRGDEGEREERPLPREGQSKQRPAERRPAPRRPRPVDVAAPGIEAAHERRPTQRGVAAVPLCVASEEPEAPDERAEAAVILLTARKKPVEEKASEAAPAVAQRKLAPVLPLTSGRDRRTKKRREEPQREEPREERRREAPEESRDERRKYPRFPMRVEVHYTSPHNFFTGFLEDISEGGLFVATYHLSEIGERFEVTFTVPGFIAEHTTVAEVCWLRDTDAGEDAIPGMGLRFLELALEVREPIQRFIKQRQSIFYEV